MRTSKTALPKAAPQEVNVISNTALAKSAPKALTFEDKVKTLLRTLAARLSDKDLAPAQLSMTYNAIKDWADNLEALKDNAKARLLALAQEKGATVSEAGTKRVIVEGWVLEARPMGAVWDDKKVMALLSGKGLSLDKFMQTTVKYAVDETKLGVLVELGKLTADEVNSCRRARTFALQPPHKVVEEGEE